MSLNHLIAHRLTRTAPTSACAFQLANEPLPINGSTEDWTRAMKYAVLRRAGKEYGRFGDDTASPFPAWLKQFSEEKISFVRFSQHVCEQLKLLLDATDAMPDGFLVFACETLENDTLMQVFWVQHEHSVYLDGDLQLSQTVFLDTDNIRFALKISMADWQSGEDYRQNNALTLLRARGDKSFAEAFVAAIGFADKVDTAEQTAQFLQAVDDYTQWLPDEAALRARKQVAEYCLEQEAHGKSVAVRDLAVHLNESLAQDDAQPAPRALDRFLAEHSPQQPPEFRANQAAVRNYVRISGRNELLSMSFAVSCIGQSVIYDAARDQLTISHVPQTLKAKLKRHSKPGVKTPANETANDH